MGFEDLPGDLLLDICDRLPCRADRSSMSAVCKPWRTVVLPRLLDAPPRLPMLWYPHAERPAFACIHSGGECHHIPTTEDVLQARFYGAYDKNWLFVAVHQRCGHQLINLRTGARIPLPDHLRLERLQRLVSPMVMQFATLSAPPVAPGTICAAIADRYPHRGRELVFWRPGDLVAWGFRGAPEVGLWILMAQDMLYYQGRLHVLTLFEQIAAFLPIFDDDEPTLTVEIEEMTFVNMERSPDDNRYLVESRGELLMVRRSVSLSSTYAFRVYRMQLLPEQDPNGALYTWAEMTELDGRILFLARGCSRSYNIHDFPGAGLREGIFFKDDIPLYGWDPENEEQGCFSAAAFDRLRKWHDNGVSSGPLPGQIETNCFRHPLLRDGFENHTPPVWLLP